MTDTPRFKTYYQSVVSRRGGYPTAREALIDYAEAIRAAIPRV